MAIRARAGHDAAMGMASTLLLVGALNGALLAVLVAGLRENRRANRFLAALIALVSLRLGIYILGFVGAYDADPGLTFLPLDLSFAFAPLLWLYVATLTGGAPPRHWRVHLTPAAIQLAYYSLCFALPLQAKRDWYGGGHLDRVEPAAMVLILLSAAAYTALSLRRYAAYQAWLDSHFANREQWRLGWLRSLVLAFAAFLALTVGFALWDWLVAPLDYFGRLPVMLGFCVLTYALGLLGWRYGGIAYPHPALSLPEPTPEAKVDYRAMSARWRERLEESGWWREDALTLPDLARRLAVSERTLSRGLNTGGGQNFNAFVNGVRVEAVQRALRDPAEDRDLLTLALDCGFASKASFNRAFKASTGLSPSAWRARHSRPEIRQSPAFAEVEATAAAD